MENNGNINNENVYYCHYTDRSISGFRNPFLQLGEALIKNNDSLRAEKLTDKYFETLPYSTGRYDRASILMTDIYTKTNPKKAEKIISELINEYTLQNNYLLASTANAGGNQALQFYSESNIITLKVALAEIYFSQNSENAGSFVTKTIEDYTPLFSEIEQRENIRQQKQGQQYVPSDRFRVFYTSMQTLKQMKSKIDGEKLINSLENNNEYTITESGLAYKIIKKSSSNTKPNITNNVKVHYTGKLTDETIFDSSIERGVPTEFPLTSVIPGWTEGLQLMSIGDKFEFIIPADLAYGETGQPQAGIGPNETLIFEVELIEIL